MTEDVNLYKSIILCTSFIIFNIFSIINSMKILLMFCVKSSLILHTVKFGEL